jgi:hypothetical protein
MTNKNFRLSTALELRCGLPPGYPTLLEPGENNEENFYINDSICLVVDEGGRYYPWPINTSLTQDFLEDVVIAFAINFISVSSIYVSPSVLSDYTKRNMQHEVALVAAK